MSQLVLDESFERFVARHFAGRGRAWLETLLPLIERYASELGEEVAVHELDLPVRAVTAGRMLAASWSMPTICGNAVNELPASIPSPQPTSSTRSLGGTPATPKGYRWRAEKLPCAVGSRLLRLGTRLGPL